MIVWLVKSIICLTLLILIYYIFLEKEKMHAFNRFYLLFSLCFSLIVPFVQLEIPINVSTIHSELVIEKAYTVQNASTNIKPVLDREGYSFNFFLFCLYILISSLLALRFSRNLFLLRRKVEKNKTLSYKKAILVLLPGPIQPHSFLYYIFLDQKDYMKGAVNPQLLTHEYAHVHQKHTIDLLLVEIIRIFLWFNPLILLYRRTIKTNHEFLADDAVIKDHLDITSYQQIILDQIKPTTHSSLTSPFFYSTTKKRFIMMTKRKSAVRIPLKGIATVSFICVLTYFFADKSYARKELESQKSSTVVLDESQQEKNEKDSLQIVKERFYGSSNKKFGFNKEDGTYVYKKYAKLTTEEKEKLPPPPLSYLCSGPPAPAQLEAFLEPSEYGIWIDGQREENTVLKNYKASDFGDVFISKLARNAKNYGKHTYQVDLSTKDYVKKKNDELLERLGIDKETMRLKL